MKLDRLTSGVIAAGAALMLTFASGCTPAGAPPAPRTTAGALESSRAGANVTGTTSLMSAQMAGPAPKVGKPRLAGSAAASDEDESDIELPKSARRSDGSRRGGGFGSSK